ncbi:MAG: DEAD/DEAH box helicase family protein [Eggerthellaceae bacterium]|nr:DEAD/DEAH box helicase family protein [Eggerthellaceae bacterium]MCH4220547.1 DEAD/DEAH box helicase family protein [Eggerthellaceae bacterium]
MPQTTFEDVLEHIFSSSANTKQQGTQFENATVFFLKNDPLWQQRFDGVWLWNDAPTKTGQDIGIDVVARDAIDGSYWAIQCKCYAEDSQLNYKEVSTFFSTAKTDERYQHFMVVDTANAWSTHLHEIAEKYNTVRIDADALNESELDWTAFLQGRSKADRTFFETMPHQKKAIAAVLKGFKSADRGKLIMACGTGKTLTALRLAEEYCPNGTVLFLAPSISLVSQTLRSWAN